MNKIERTITINAPVHTVFETIREPLNLPKLCTNLMAVADVQQIPSGGKNFKWEYKIMNVRFWGTSSVTEYDIHRRIVNSIQGGITGKLTWLFSAENGQTHVSLSIEYGLPSPLVQKHGANDVIRENEDAVTALLENLKAMLEQASGQLINANEAKSV